MNFLPSSEKFWSRDKIEGWIERNNMDDDKHYSLRESLNEETLAEMVIQSIDDDTISLTQSLIWETLSCDTTWEVQAQASKQRLEQLKSKLNDGKDMEADQAKILLDVLKQVIKENLESEEESSSNDEVEESKLSNDER